MGDRAAALRVLGLSDSATDDEVRSAYKRLKTVWHSGGAPQHTVYGEDEYFDEDEDYDSEDEYETDEGFSDSGSEGEDRYEPFKRDSMDFAGFMKMYGRMKDRGDIDEDGRYVASNPVGGSSRAKDYCYCPECQRLRRQSKTKNKEERQRQARAWKMEREAEAAAEKAKEAADKMVQMTDPKNSLAWKRGGESRERLVREHFLKQTPSLVLHAAYSTSLTLVLDIPDVSLLDNGKLPPKGVEWEVSYCATGSKKWQQQVANKEYDNVTVLRLTPGTEYAVKVRSGLAGSHTWSGSPDWGPWSPVQKFKTSGQPPSQHGSGSGGKKKKKNRDAAFAKLTQQKDEQQQQGDAGSNADTDAATTDEEEEEEKEEEENEAVAAAGLQLSGAGRRGEEDEKSEGSEADADTRNLADLGLSEDGDTVAAPAGPPAGQRQQQPQQQPQQQHKPRFVAPCVYFPLGKCDYGSNCRFRHVMPGEEAAGAAAPALAGASAAAGGSSSSASSPRRTARGTPSPVQLQLSDVADGDLSPKSAALVAKMEVGQLDALLSTFTGPPTLDKAREVAKLSQRIAARMPVARYQPAPVGPDGAFLKPLFLTAYNVVEDGYAAWYRDLQAGGRPRTARHAPGAVRQKFDRVIQQEQDRDRQSQQALQQTPKQPQPPSPAAQQQLQNSNWPSAGPAALAPAGSGSASSSGGGATAHKPKYASLCKWFPLGTCKFGDRCAFMHYVDSNGNGASGGGSSSGGGYQGSSGPPPPQQQPPQQQQYGAAPAASAGHVPVFSMQSPQPQQQLQPQHAATGMAGYPRYQAPAAQQYQPQPQQYQPQPQQYQPQQQQYQPQAYQQPQQSYPQVSFQAAAQAAASQAYLQQQQQGYQQQGYQPVAQQMPYRPFGQ